MNNSQQKEIILRIYGDSRSKHNYWRETPIGTIYSEQLKNLIEADGCYKVYLSDKSFGGYDIKKIYKNFSNDNDYWGDSKGIVIIFIGIVDCAPRLLNPITRWIVSKLNKKIREKIINFLHKNRTKLLRIKYNQMTPIKKFRKYYSRMVKKTAENNKVYCMGIGPVANDFKTRSLGLEKEMTKYNQCIQEIVRQYDNCEYVDLAPKLQEIFTANNLSDDEVFVGDGHHFTPICHKYIAEILFNTISVNI